MAVLQKGKSNYPFWGASINLITVNHDGIPWNNNNAEHSIKPFAKWKKKISKSLTKKNIEHHLILLSILQTCKYQGINFFEFLKSGKKSIYEYSEK